MVGVQEMVEVGDGEGGGKVAAGDEFRGAGGVDDEEDAAYAEVEKLFAVTKEDVEAAVQAMVQSVESAKGKGRGSGRGRGSGGKAAAASANGETAGGKGARVKGRGKEKAKAKEETAGGKKNVARDRQR